MRIGDLGALVVEVGGAVRPPAGAKQVAILSRLVVDVGRRVSIDQLVEAGWGVDADVATATIENHVWRLRRLLDLGSAQPSCVANDNGGYRLRIGADELDSVRFETAAAAARELARDGDYAGALQRSDEALALWRGTPYEPIAHVNAAEAAAARLTELHGQLTEGRVDALLATGDTGRALLELEELTIRHPYRERLWAQRMTGLARLGRTEEALQTYGRVREILLDELGLEPGAELRELQRAIISQEHEPPPGPPVDLVGSRPQPATLPQRVLPRAPIPQWPLVGREQALGVIEVARRGGEPGVVLTGAAGVGKSRLLQEGAAAAERDGAVVVRVQATRSAAAVPLGAFTDVLPAQAPSGELFGLLQNSAAFLRGLAGDGGLVLAVDDAQLLDELSAALVLHMLTSGGAFVLATVRPREPCPDAVTSLSKDAGALRLDVEALDEVGTRALVEAILGGRAERASAHWAFRLSRGNAFFVRELLRSARSEGALAPTGGVWRLVGEPQVAGSLAELAAGTLGALSQQERHAMELLAVGEPLRVADLASMVGLDVLVAVEERGLLHSETGPGGHATIAHPLYAAVLRSQLPTLRLARTVRELIELTRDRADRTPQDTLRLIRWQLELGERLPGGQLLEGARAALSAGDGGTAAELAALAVDDGVGVEGDLVHARALILQRDYPGAAVVLNSAEPNLRTQDQAFAYLEAQSEVLHWGLRKPERLHELLDRAARWFDDAAWLDRIRPLSLRLASFERLGAVASGPDGTATVAVRVGNLFYSGQTSEAGAIAAANLPEIPIRDLDGAIVLSLWARIAVDSGADWAGAEQRLDALLDEALRRGDPAVAGQAAYSLAELHLAGGRPADSLALCIEAEGQLVLRDPVGLLPVVAASRAIAACALNDAAEAERALQHGRELLEGPPLGHQLPYLTRAEAWAAHLRGDHAAAQRTLLDAAQQLTDSPVHVARMTYEALRAGAAARNLVPTLELMASRCDARLVQAYARHARAKADDDGARLLDVAAELVEIGATNYAREAAADAVAAFLRDHNDAGAAQAAALVEQITAPIGQSASQE